MLLEDVIINSSDFKTLCQEIQFSKVGKSMLLICKDSDYAFDFAKFLALAYLGNGQVKHDENYAKLIALSHPDIKIYPSKDKLFVADSQEIALESFVKPIFAEKKIFIIKNIDNSMEAAQNKLLKTLEEPPKGIVFILTCSNINLVLPTIRSRCQKEELSKLPTSVIESFLNNKTMAEAIAAISDGFPGKAIKLDKMKNFEEIFNLSLSLLTTLENSKQVISYSKQILAYKDNINLIFEILSLALEDMLAIKAGKTNLVRLKNYEVQLKDKLENYTARAMCEIQKLLDEASRHIAYNTNITLVIENLLLDILEVKYICK